MNDVLDYIELNKLIILIFASLISLIVWLSKYFLKYLFLKHLDKKKSFSKIHTELTTRISTQELPDGHGNEKTALDSLYKLFTNIRELKLSYPLSIKFQIESSKILKDIRPFTAKWHNISEDEGFKSKETCNNFRSELRELQKKLRVHANRFSNLLKMDTK